jgi:hypothetical protein
MGGTLIFLSLLSRAVFPLASRCFYILHIAFSLFSFVLHIEHGWVGMGGMI